MSAQRNAVRQTKVYRCYKDVFLVIFLVGLLGFVLMTAMGFLHTGHGLSGGHRHAVGGHTAPALGHSTSHGMAAGHHAPSAHVAPAAKALPNAPSKVAGKEIGLKADRTSSIFVMLSPVTIFSLMMGAGATGVLLSHMLVGGVLWLAALAGALVFWLALVRPLTSALANFASRPSDGLEGAVARPATAATRFDASGRGLISLTLDGQNVQVLGILESDEVSRGVQVAKGDPLTIVEVDKVRNSCRVTRELAD